ncbi:MAG: LPXTG cell wall anchor domain-containing protein, partial [Gemella haemolysans]|uniref:LPXTG cell wall anchor domain-containing protein n=1 Tax=Gemella haemolysans TaxID=1379 RepID=UPI0026EC15F2
INTPADKAVVKDPANLTDAEKKAIEDKVKAVNLGATVVVDDKGNATVTTPEGKTAVIPATDLVKSPEEATKPNAGNDIVKPADKTVVANPDALTPEEKKAIEDKVKAVNPGATVVVDDKGNATVTTPEGKTAVIPASDLVVAKAANNGSNGSNGNAGTDTTNGNSNAQDTNAKLGQRLANTGTTETNTGLAGLGLGALGGLLAAARRRKNDKN